MDRIDGAQQIISKQVEQCDPYSSFGIFCNTNSFLEGLLVIAGVFILLGAAVYFVKRNQEANQDRHREKYKKYIQ